MTVAEKVGQYIAQHNIDMEAVAADVEVSVEDLTTMLQGMQTLDADVFRRICLALNISPEYFLESDTETNKTTKGTDENE